MSDLKEFADKMHSAGRNLKSDLALLLDAEGVEMLDIIQDKIKELDAVDTRNLISSFDKEHKGEGDGIYRLDRDSLKLTIGTNVKYASAVNDGHWLNPKGVKMRFVPGHWNPDGGFEYEPGARTGMLLKQDYIEAKPFMDRAVHIMETTFPEDVENRIEAILEKYLN